jgi:hypothetical protein
MMSVVPLMLGHEVSHQNGAWRSGAAVAASAPAFARHMPDRRPDRLRSGGDGARGSPRGLAARARERKQVAAQRELGTMAVGEKAEMADAVKAIRHDVQQETSHELVCGQGHHLGLAVPPVDESAPKDGVGEATIRSPDDPGVATSFSLPVTRSGRMNAASCAPQASAAEQPP